MPTKIEWVINPDGSKGETWNPVTGCSHAGSPGCDLCYARRMAHRLAGRCGYPESPNHFDVTLHFDRLQQPLRWKKPRMIFVVSMGDLFHKDVPQYFISQVFKTMAACPQHTFQVLTKRPGLMKMFFVNNTNVHGQLNAHDEWIDWPLPNVWLGVSVENQATADERREYLRQTPAAVKFVSYEPALGPVDWTGWEFVDQIISGGESGPKARPSHPDWHRATRDFCQRNGIAFFFKQNGAWMPIGDFDSQTGVYHYSWQHAKPFKQVASIGLDGKVYSNDFPPRRGWHMARVGKKRAGHLLDGKEWREFPDVG